VDDPLKRALELMNATVEAGMGPGGPGGKVSKPRPQQREPMCAECGRFESEIGLGGRSESQQSGSDNSMIARDGHVYCGECSWMWDAAGHIVVTPRSRQGTDGKHPTDCDDPLFYNGIDKGTVDLARQVTHDVSGIGKFTVNKDAVVGCDGWSSASSNGKRTYVETAFSKLKTYGYVVLERLLPAEPIAALEEEFYKMKPLPGFTSIPLRARRTQAVMPFTEPWNADWLIKNDLLLELVVRYVCNNDAVKYRSEEDSKWAFVQWCVNGATTEWYMPGPSAEGEPGVGLVEVINTPPGAMPQNRHRDINLPGPCASLHVHIPLTPLRPDNGPIGFVPGSHRTETPGVEVIACPPRGSAVLYDSFTEHRGCENTTDGHRCALNATFHNKDVMTGYTPYHFGRGSWPHTLAYRRDVNARLREIRSELISGLR